MIKGFRHKGLQLLFETGARRRLNPELVDKIERVLARLDDADQVMDMALPGFRLHELKGQRAGTWAVTISGNWRLVFRFEDGHAIDIDLVDYH
jgi:proteic killer suppression protein